MSIVDEIIEMTQELRTESLLCVESKRLREKFYVKPLAALSLQDRQKVGSWRRKIRDGVEDYLAMAEEIVFRALDETGKKRHHPADVITLKNEASGDATSFVWLLIAEADQAFDKRMQEKYKTDSPEPLSDVAAIEKN